MRWLFALLAVWLVAPAVASADDIARGVVFRDRNGNGAQDTFDFGVRGVAVSNGRDVERTDWRGRYEIAAAPGDFVFVVKPRSYTTPLVHDGLPRFYRRVAEAGPARVDFPLTRRRESSEFRAVVFGDSQVYDEQQLGWLARDVVAELVGVDAAFGITLGDLVGDDITLFGPLNRVVGRIGLPWYNAGAWVRSTSPPSSPTASGKSASR